MKYILISFLIAGLWARDVNNLKPTGPSNNENTDELGGGSESGGNAPSGSVGSNYDPNSPEAKEVDKELSDVEKMKLGFERQTVQPEWVQRFNIDSDDIHNRVAQSEDFVEVISNNDLVAFDSENDNKKHTFSVVYMKASDWIFLTFVDLETQEKHEFFFPYTSLVSKDVIFLRVLLDECLKPETHVPQPPTIAKCHYFYKKTIEAYDFAVKEVGPVQGAELMECYIESVKKMTRQPRVEILCSTGAAVDEEYRQLTREQFEKIKASHTLDENGQYVGKMEETETTKVNAK